MILGMYILISDLQKILMMFASIIAAFAVIACVVYLSIRYIERK
jgi:hypothetical protein